MGSTKFHVDIENYNKKTKAGIAEALKSICFRVKINKL